MTRWRRRLMVLLVATGLVVLLWTARGWLLPPLARWLDVGEPPRAADFVMVLPGDQSVRPFVAASLVKVGLAQRALVPKTVAEPVVVDGILPPTHEVIRRVLVRRGVPEDRIIVLQEGETSHTHSDAVLLAAFLRDRPDARVIVVTSHYHTRRARWTFSRVLDDRAKQVCFVSAPTDRFTADNWWQCQEGLIAVGSEYLKLAYYAARYGSLCYWAFGCAAVIAAVVIWLIATSRRQRPTVGSQTPQAPPES